MTAPDLFIERLRLHGSGDNQVGLRLGVEQALRRVRLGSRQLPPHATLVIRRFRSESIFNLKQAQMYEWQRSVQEQIDALAKRAYRPGQQHVPPTAESVLFFDDVALLVCFSRDALSGHTAWYWADLFGSVLYAGQPTGERLLSGWARYPQAVPHSLVELKPSEAIEALNRLNPGQLARLAHLLHETFRLPGDIFNAVVGGSAAAEIENIDGIGADRFQDTGASHPKFPHAPWRRWLEPAEYPGLTPQAEYILGLCHTLVKRPQQARQEQFARQARQWLEIATSRTVRERAKETAAHVGGPLPVERIETADSEPETKLPGGIHTDLGGILYLVNLLTALELPDALPSLKGVNVWELLGAIAADLLGSRFSDYQPDPIWSLIHELTGLEAGERWGAGVPEADYFSLPQRWLDIGLAGHFSEPDNIAAPTWDGGGLMEANLLAYVARLRPFLVQYLDALTGLTAESILHHPGTLYVSRTHIDLRLTLDQISLPIRRAGLDRSPGWLPQFSRIFTIYFE